MGFFFGLVLKIVFGDVLDQEQDVLDYKNFDSK